MCLGGSHKNLTWLLPDPAEGDQYELVEEL